MLAVSLSYSLWIINILIQWIAVPQWLLYRAWQFALVFETAFFVSILFFASSFIGEEIAKKIKLFSLFVWLPVPLFIFSSWNVYGYNFELCQGELGILWKYIYGLEFFSILAMLISFIYSFKSEIDEQKKSILKLACLAIISFSLLFWGSNFFGEIYQVYQINLIGTFGALLFLTSVFQLVHRYHLFYIPFFGVQFLIYTSIIFLAGLIFIEDIDLIHVVLGLTVFVVWFLGRTLIKLFISEKKIQIDLKKAIDDLALSNKKLVRLEKLKTEFVSLASHQLRSPLTAIKGYASMLLEGDFDPLTPKQTEAADRVFQSTEHLVQVVEDLLNVSKIEQGGMQYTAQLFDLKRDLLELVNEMQIIAQKRGLALSFDFDPQYMYAIKGDREKLRQVFLNLIDNAIKYTKVGSIAAHLTKNTDQSKVVFSVVDTGVGIDPANIPKLFEKFGRGEAGKMNTGGSGLGLYLAKEIVAAHNGTVTITSPGVGKGTTFTVELAGM